MKNFKINYESKLMRIKLLSIFLLFFNFNSVHACLTQVPGSPFTTGNGPLSIAFSTEFLTPPRNVVVAVTNSDDNRVSVYLLDKTTGALTPVGGPNPVTGVNPVSIAFTPEFTAIPNNVFAAVANQNSNTITIYPVDKVTGVFGLSTTLVGTGLSSPGSIAFTQELTGKVFAAVANRSGNTVAIYDVDPTTGAFTLADTESVGNDPISVAFTQELTTGKVFLAVLNNLSQSVNVFDVDKTNGTLTPTTPATFATGSDPRSIAFTRNTAGNVFAAVTNSDDGTVTVFTVDVNTGEFIFPVTYSTGFFSFPLSVAFTEESGGMLYSAVVNANENVSLFNVNPTTGVFTQNSGPFATQSLPFSIAISSLLSTSNIFIGTANFNSNNLTMFKLTLLLATPTLNTVNANCNADVTVTGSGALPNATITVLADGNSIGSGSADGTGNFNFTVASGLFAGTYAITVTQTDSTGCSGPSNSINLTVQAAGQPFLDDPLTVVCGNVTVRGGANPNATITVFADGNEIGTGQADINGLFNFLVQSDLPAGNYSITVTQTDPGSLHCTSIPSNAVLVTSDKPAPPTLATASAANCDNDITVTGSGAEPNATITVFAGATNIGFGDANGSGDFNFTITTSLAAGIYQIRVTQTNAVPCTSELSNSRDIGIATKIPPNLSSATVDCSGNELTVVGSGAQANAAITVFADLVNVGNSNADGSGNFDFTMILNPALTAGSHSITVTQTNFGCETGPSNAKEVTVVGCEFRIISPPTNTTTTNRMPTFVGIGPADSNIVIFDIFPSNTIMLTKKIEKSFATTIIGETTSDSDGNFSFTPTTPLALGTHTIFAALASDTNIRSNRVVITIASSGVLGDSLTRAIFNKYGCSL